MNTDRPIVLIYSGNVQTDNRLRNGLTSAFPNLGIRTVQSASELETLLPDVEVLLAWQFPFERLTRPGTLRWLQLLGAGLDSLDGVELPSELKVSNVRGVFGPEMAEYAITYMLAHQKNLLGFRRYQREHRWAFEEPRMLAGKTVGVLGLGSIGRIVAQRCRELGMKVLGLKRTAESIPGIDRVYVARELDELLPLCDFLVLVLPSTLETKGLITKARFAQMKPGAFLVNMGRGNVLDESALADALGSGRLSGAAIDVFANEPLAPRSPLWDFENIFITPHIAGISRPDTLLPVLERNLGHYLLGEPLEFLVDPKRGY